MPTTFQLTRLQEILHAEIPISAAMGLMVVPDGDGFVLDAPLEPNRNLQNTFFGGSLNALGLLAGWSWLRLALREEQLEPDIVVQRSATDFISPVPGLARARPHAPDEETWERFLRTVRKRGRGRIAIEILITSPPTDTDLTHADTGEIRMVGWYAALGAR